MRLHFLLFAAFANSVISDDQLKCKSVTVYYVGKFQNPLNPSDIVNLEFQLKLTANDTEQKIYVRADEWNSSLADPSDFQLQFFYDGGFQLCDDIEQGCSGPYAKNTKLDFLVDLNVLSVSNEYHLIYFKPFDNFFRLDNAVGQCTNSQAYLNDKLTPNKRLYKYCACCGDYLPDPSLNCPVDPWQPQQKKITCSSISAYFGGKFHNELNPDNDMNVAFELKMWADNKRIYAEIAHWDEKYTKSKDIEFWLTSGNGGGARSDPPIGSNCSVPYSNQTYVFLGIQHNVNGKFDNDFAFLYFAEFEGKFALYDVVGSCTKFQQIFDYVAFVDTTLFEFCMCCGDYRPDPSLNCPKNPWPPQQTNITCPSITAYYNGLFFNNVTDDHMPVEFQVKMLADNAKIYFEIDHWNEDKTKSSDIWFMLYDDNYGYSPCDPPINTNCSGSFSEKVYTDLFIRHYINEDWADDFFFLHFRGVKFTLHDAVGQCTKYQEYTGSFAIKPEYVESCMCCGDYRPDPSLNCPKNPWALQ